MASNTNVSETFVNYPNKGKISDIPVPKKYILIELHKKISAKLSHRVVKTIENYIKKNIPHTHFTHVSEDLQKHIQYLIKKLIPSSSIQQYVAKMYITRGLKDIIEKGQKKCAAKKRKIPRITNKEIQRDAAKK